VQTNCGIGGEKPLSAFIGKSYFEDGKDERGIFQRKIFTKYIALRRVFRGGTYYAVDCKAACAPLRLGLLLGDD
jgi:hypothetical protein